MSRVFAGPMPVSRRRLLKAAAYALPFWGPELLAQRTAPPGRPRPDDDVVELSVRAALRHIRQGDMKAAFYAERLLAQYHDHRNLNAVIALDEPMILEQAHAVDRARARGDRLGPLAGLPFLVKDQIDVAGYPTTTGTSALKGYRPSRSAVVVDTMVQGGGIVFGKTNLLSGPTSSNRFYGFVRNPYDLARVPGGSSGGNGAAIAARIAPAGLGQDSGGSIRIPAAFCGIAGLRPSTAGSRKRYSDSGLVMPATPEDSQTIGPMARTVADVALLDTVITGEQVPDPPALRGLRLGVPSGAYWERRDVDRGLATCMHEAFAKLRDAGVRLIEIDFEELVSFGDVLAPAFASSDRDRRATAWLAQNAPGVSLQDLSYGRAASTRAAPPQELSATAKQALRAKAGSRYSDIFRASGIVAIAFPPEPVPAPVIQPAGDSPDDQVEVNGALTTRAILTRNTWWGARLGVPGLVLPAGLTAGLPVGLELEGMPGEDSRLLALGIAVENLLGTLPPPPFVHKIA